MDVLLAVLAVLVFLVGLAGLAVTGLALWATSSDRRAEKAERWIRRWKERDR